MVRRLARLGAERATPEAVQAAMAALDGGERPEGEAAEIARGTRAFLLAAVAQSLGGGELTEQVRAVVSRDMTVQEADLELARRLLGDWHARYGPRDGGAEDDGPGDTAARAAAD